ncbi:hypothetical protein BC937DRAFT_86870 [Endogone sp. FLAS-F59071]|nr:hypothetical protein BC937DRAFT_86870 [Endogone sp. FLAS-F59071]|eukprot:RUS22790.1 hypothetical protein BC937DRAFT_86870 [Endogone sp. FLAS-F59071]
MFNELCISKLQANLFIGGDYLLGDDRYKPCTPYLICPYPKPPAGPKNDFNKCLSKICIVVKYTFRCLKGQFEFLTGICNRDVSKAVNIIYAAFILYNFIEINNDNSLVVNETSIKNNDESIGVINIEEKREVEEEKREGEKKKDILRNIIYK